MAAKTKKKKAAKKQPAPKASRWAHYRLPLTALAIMLVLMGVCGVGVVAFARQYDDRILPHSSVGSVDISDLSYDQALTELRTTANDIIDAGITVLFNGQAISVDTVLGDPANSELATPLVTYRMDEALAQLQHTQQSMSDPQRAYYALRGSEYAPVVTIDADALEEALTDALGQYTAPATNADLDVVSGTIAVVPAKSGTTFDYEAIMSTVATQWQSLEKPSVTISLIEDNPDISDAVAEIHKAAAQQIIDHAPYTITYDDQSWEISSDQVRDWISVVMGKAGAQAGLDPTSLDEYLATIAQEVDVSVQEARFQMENGRVVEFQPSQTGKAVDIATTAAAINDALRSPADATLTLTVDEVQPEQTTGSLNDLGIVELIGEGRSNFSGSPANRRHNISVGADSLNGLIIEPDEEFSLIKALGEIDGEHGYKQELVIKGNKTIPEYGGGLCQIGTTTFRAVLSTGMKITERRNHSYRVSYYEPAGTDATIYDPAPDFKFINDTGHHVLLTTEIDGNELIFRFYGTSDGRTVSLTDPRIYNYVAPGPTKLVETTDLAPGVKKCTERAHTGADADFTRTIIYADGEVYEETFHSHYKPWQEVCLIGVETLSEDTATE